MMLTARLKSCAAAACVLAACLLLPNTPAKAEAVSLPEPAETVAKQTGTGLFALTMGMDGGAAGCTDAIYHNIDIIREALS